MRTPITIGTCSLGTMPRIVAVIDRRLPERRIRRLKILGADMLEVRVDLFPCAFEKTLGFVRMLRRKSRLPIIATIRETKDTKGKRLEMFGRLMPLVDAIDVEIDAQDGRDIIKRARGKTVIISEHDFSGTPSESRLSSIVKRARSMGADIVKIAAMARSRGDAARLMRFAAGRRENLVAISMGEYGAVSRIAAPLFGSLFTYTFVSRRVAPGQLPLKETAALLRKLYPARMAENAEPGGRPSVRGAFR